MSGFDISQLSDNEKSHLLARLLAEFEDDGREQAILKALECKVRREEPGESPKLPEPLDLARITTEPPPAPDWVVKDLILAGTVGVLIGEGAVGKSWFTLYLAVNVATALLGSPFDVPRPQRVFIFNFEDPVDELKRRLYWLLRPYDGLLDKIKENFFVYPLYGQAAPLARYGRDRNPETTESFQVISQIIATQRPRLTILDTFSRCFGLTENSNEDVAWFLATLESLAREYGTAIMLVHHQSKSLRGERIPGSARGATALTDNARFALTITKLNEEEKHKFGLPLQEKIFRIDSIKLNYSTQVGPWFFKHLKDAAPEPIDVASLYKDHLIKSVVQALRMVAPDGASLRDLNKSKEFRQLLRELTGQSAVKILAYLEKVIKEAVHLGLVTEERVMPEGRGRAKTIYRPA